MLSGEDILVVTDGFWDAPKRLRHKMPLKWAAAGCRVLWVEQPPFPFSDWRMPGRLANGVTGKVRQVAERLWVASMPPALPHMYKGGAAGDRLLALHRPLLLGRLFRRLRTLELRPRLVVLFQQAARWDIFDAFPRAGRIYYHHDVYGYGHATPGQAHNLRVCCEKADQVWCVSKAHRQTLAAFNESTFHIPHAVDAEWWERHSDRVPSEYRDIPSPRVVYTGVFQEKMDLPLLVGAAEQRPDWHFVFVGPVQPSYLDGSLIARLRGLPNAHLLGERDVDDIPGFLAGADLLMLPYTANENTREAGLALKFYEYLISGKPVVMTPFTALDISAEGLVHIAKGVDGWCGVLDTCLGGDAAAAKQRVALAYRNTYEARLEAQRRALEQLTP